MKLKSENLSEIKKPASLAKSLLLSEPAWGPFILREAREARLSGVPLRAAPRC